MTDLELFREKADNYIVCFANDCPLHAHCLRWRVGQVASDTVRQQTVVNPHHPDNCNAHCKFYRNDRPVLVGIGMAGFFHDMPHYQELAIKKDIIGHFTRTRFYRMRKGTIPVSPDDQSLIAAICRQHGWTAEPRYDHYKELYLW